MNKFISKILRSSDFGENIYNYIYVKEKTYKNKQKFENIDINEKQIIFSSFQGRSYACSPRAIYEYMITSPDYNEYNFIWAFSQPSCKTKYFSDTRTKLVKYNSAEFFECLASSKYWIFNFKTPEYFVKREGQFFVQCWHGTPLKRLGCDIKVEGNKATKRRKIHKSYLEDAKKYDYFISPSRYCTEKFVSAFALDKLKKEQIVVETGYPRNDSLFCFNEADINRIKQELELPENKKVILYAPTFRDNQFERGVGHTYQLGVNLLKLKDKLGDEYVILLRLHYLVANRINISQFKGFAYDVSKYDNINDLYIISDVLVTDYSSVFFDYANLERAIIFYMYDLDEYKNNIRDFYIDLKELPGPTVEQEEDLIESVQNIENIRVEYKDNLKRFNSKFNYLDDGKAAERVIKEFVNCVK